MRASAYLEEAESYTYCQTPVTLTYTETYCLGEDLITTALSVIHDGVDFLLRCVRLDC